MSDIKPCQHHRLHFGSGDFYVFCGDCNHRWVTIAHVEGIGDRISPSDANQGFQVDGKWRVISDPPPPNPIEETE